MFYLHLCAKTEKPLDTNFYLHGEVKWSICTNHGRLGQIELWVQFDSDKWMIDDSEQFNKEKKFDHKFDLIAVNFWDQFKIKSITLMLRQCVLCLHFDE